MGTKISISDLSAIDATALAPLNQALDDLADEFDKVVYRDGTSPSQLTADLDANSNKVVNLGAPVNNSDAVRLQDLSDSGDTTTAATTTLDDSAGDFTSDNVEGALGELGDLTALTTAEIDQLENIDTVTISNTQWGYVGALDQSLATTDAVTFAGNDPEHATDSGTDTYVSATNTTVPADGVKITRDFQSASTTTTPTLDAKTMTTRDGSALWAGAVSGVHDVQYDSGADTYLVLEPNPSQQRDLARLATASLRGDVAAFHDEDDMASDDPNGVASQQSVKAYVDTEVAAGDPTLDTVVDATNGGADDLTEIDFTGIKSGAKRITIIFRGVSVSGTDSYLVQLGDSGGFETSGYNSISGILSGTKVSSSSGFISRSAAGTDTWSGTIVLTRVTGNWWIAKHGLDRVNDDGEFVDGGGDKELSAELTQIRITPNGSNTFDNGEINILVE